MKSVVIAWLIFGCIPFARADVNLAVISTAGAVDGSPRAASTAQKYARPTAADLVRLKDSDTWVRFDKVPADAAIEVCGDDVPDGTVSTWGAPCTKWPWLAAGQVPKVVGPVTANRNTLLVSWAPPTQNTDGSALTNLSGYRIYYGPTISAQPNFVDLAAPATEFKMTGLPAGTISLSMTALAGSAESDRTPVVSGVTKPPVISPASPRNLRSDDQLTVYDIVKAKGKLTLKAIGAVTIGTLCTPSEGAPAGMGVVPTASVVPKTTVLAPVARCP
jgi:hypothetical protein